ncbi:MAG TPA: c-type cytochrome [Steroidobacteraceae bacterium]|nr:c-type cytochrome [Steroidobacteraceae bacterium]
MSTLIRRAVCAGSLPAFVLLCSCGGSPGPAPASATSAPPAIRYPSHLAAGGELPPGAIPEDPKAGDPATIKAGETLFTAMNCDGCHGTGGTGWVGPSLADGRWRYGGSDAAVFASVYFGRPKGMPAFGGKLGIDGVWTLVTYIKSLPVPPDIATESWEGH